MAKLFYVGSKTVELVDAAEYERYTEHGDSLHDDGVWAIVRAEDEQEADEIAQAAFDGIIQADNIAWSFDCNSNGGDCNKTVVGFIA